MSLLSAHVNYLFLIILSVKLFHHIAADTITSVQFDGSGEYLATGDRGGRIVLFTNSPADADGVR
jgi:hypothetical protein